MSIQTQGADGAGTKTAGQVEHVSLAECPIGLFLAASGALCLKTEYGDNEGRIDAYIVESGEFFWGRSPQSIPSQRRQMVTPVPLEQIADAIHLPFKKMVYATPAPAATPGVPDSLRALSEAATEGAWVFERMHDDFVGVYSDDRTGSVIANFAGFHAAPRPKAEQDANARFAAEAVNHVRALIAAQPAGQAGDAGAETERLREAVSKALHDNQFLDGWPEMVDPVVEAVLAARLEAPSDAGWNFDMEAAPQDGTRILLWMHGCWIHPVIGYRAPSAPGSQRDCWREHGSRARIHRADCWRLIPAGPTPPSDPAPSGQAEGTRKSDADDFWRDIEEGDMPGGFA